MGTSPKADFLRIAVVGGGVAGALLAWRLHQVWRQAVVHVFTGAGHSDASAASGGLVRGFEPDPGACAAAAESMAELGRNATLREWAGYREVGSLFLLAPGADPAASLRTVDSLLPGSAAVLSGAQLRQRFPLTGLPDGATGIVERHAGYLSPGRLRDSVLAELAARGTTIRRVDVSGVTPAPAVRLADGTRLRYDVVVVAAGAWTPRLLAGSGLSTQGLRTKHIQYSLMSARMPGLGAFVDDGTGLYGRPAGGGTFLLGLPSPRWDVEPDDVTADHALAARVLEQAREQLGVPVEPLRPPRTVAAFDCYHPQPGLALRRCAPGAPLFTFTGGSGGAAKSVLAASRVAAHALMQLHARRELCTAGAPSGAPP